MALPPLPRDLAGSGWDWMAQLAYGWFPISSWGLEGWDLGCWPLVCVAHFDGETFGVATYVECDVLVEEFLTAPDRDRATDEIAVFYWQLYSTKGAPKSLDDERLGPYEP